MKELKKGVRKRKKQKRSFKKFRKKEVEGLPWTVVRKSVTVHHTETGERC